MYFLAKQTQKHKRNICSLTAHRFHFIDTLYSVIPQNPTFVKVASKNNEIAINRRHISDFMGAGSEKILPAKKKHVHMTIYK